jgi:BCD family chlorophyll transporter-like MFS transporter
MKRGGLSWVGIMRLGLVQACVGAIVVLMTSTMNRVMVVELAMPAILPGLLVALHYAVQIARPRFGYGSDVGGRRTPWIVGGMALLGLGAVGAAAAIAVMAVHPVAGIMAAIGAFALIGIGVGAAGTSLLVLLAKLVDASRRPAAATIVWMMLIVGFVVTTAVAGHLLAPFSPARLIAITAGVAAVAFAVTVLAVWNVEDRAELHPELPVRMDAMRRSADGRSTQRTFRAALGQVWGESQTRRFTIFVFVSMLAYSGQELIVDPFAGAVFHLTPAQSTALSSVQHAGTFLGMLLIAIIATSAGSSRLGSLRRWTVAGCIGSAFALVGLALAGPVGPAWPLRASIFALGVANGAFAVAAIGSMMALAGTGSPSRDGLRMGLWGAAQALAFAAGGVIATGAVDIARHFLGEPTGAYSTVFAGEAMLFLYASALAARLGSGAQSLHAPSPAALYETAVAEVRWG